MSWTITKAQNELAYIDDLICQVINDNPLPLPVHDQRIGHVETHWTQVEPGIAYVTSNPEAGTPEDRRLAEAVVLAQLRPHGFKQAEWSLRPDLSKTSDWGDVTAKAQRLVQSGAVQLQRNSYNTVRGIVHGDGTDNDGQPDVHTVEIMRQDPTSQAITGSHCDCDWGQFQNLPRTRNWKRYQNRPCSHILATYWVSQAMPFDEDRQPGGGDQMSLFGPDSGGQAPASMGLMQRSPYIDSNAWWLNPGSRQPGNIDQPISQGGMMPSPGGMGGPQGGAGGVPGQAPSPQEALPQFPMEGGPPPLPEVNPASVPGGRPGPTPTDPIQYPGGTFSKYGPKRATIGPMSATLYRAAQHFNNGDVVLLTQSTKGNLVGRPEVEMTGVGFGPQAPGALGDPIDVPRGAVGEVLGTDPVTQMVNVLWTGNAFDQNTQRQPFGAMFWAWPSELQPARSKPPGPAIRRT